MCGGHTEAVVLPKPTPKPAETGTFGFRLESQKVTGVEAGQRARVRGINDLRLNRTPSLTTE